MDKATTLTLVLLVPLCAAVVGLWLLRHPGRPRGNVKGTRLENSETLRRLNVALLAVLALSCFGALLFVQFRMA